MTKEEICKILECCSSPEYRCNECPIDQKKKDDCECGTFGMGEALTLIKELTEENKKITINMNAYGLTAKRLSEENERLRAERDTLDILVKDFKFRLGEAMKANQTWEEKNKDLECDNDMLRERITEIRADTVREMQSAIKKYYSSSIYRPTQKHPTKHTMIEHLFYVIDQIAKEMIGGKI